MLIELKKIPEGTSSQIRSFLLPETLVDGLHLQRDIEAEIVYRKFNTLIVVEIAYTTSFSTECARCLTDISQELKGSVSLTLGMSEDEELASDAVDFYRYEYDQESVDVHQTLFDDIMTRIPIRVLCSEDCEGLTLPESVTEKQKEAPAPKEIDSRWAALKKLSNKD